MDLLEQAVGAEWVGFSAITRLELFGYPGLENEEEDTLTRILSAFEEVPVTSAIVDRAIRIRRQVRIKTPDALIAATALEEGAALATRNEDDFKVVAGLIIINPWKE